MDAEQVVEALTRLLANEDAKNLVRLLRAGPELVARELVVNWATGEPDHGTPDTQPAADGAEADQVRLDKAEIVWKELDRAQQGTFLRAVEILAPGVSPDVRRLFG